MKVLIAVFCLALSACDVDGYVINNSLLACEKHDGINHIDLLNSISVCSDGYIATGVTKRPGDK